MQYRATFALLGLSLLASVASASDSDPYHLLARVQALRAPADAPRAPDMHTGAHHEGEEDAHMLVRRAHRMLDEGDAPEDVQQQLSSLLAAPSYIENPDAPRAPSSEGPFELRTKHFRVFYFTGGEHAAGADGDGDGVPDKAAWVASAFERAYQREVVEMGYPSPPDIPQYRVTLKRLRVNALTHPMRGKPGHTWCEFNFAMREGGTEDQIRSKYRAVASHEFFHAVQALFNWNEEDWWVEGSADWMSELADPGNGFFRANSSLRQRRPEVGLASNEPFFPYAGSLFAAYLTPTAQHRPDLVQDVWREVGKLRKKGLASGSKRNAYVRDAIRNRLGRSFEEIVTMWWPHVYLRDFPGGEKLPPATRVRIKSYPATAAADTLPRPDPLGANFFELHPPEGGGDVRVRVRATGNKKARLGVRVLTLNKERYLSVPVSANGEGVVETTISGLGSEWNAATLCVVNLGRSKPGIQVEAEVVGAAR